MVYAYVLNQSGHGVRSLGEAAAAASRRQGPG